MSVRVLVQARIGYLREFCSQHVARGGKPQIGRSLPSVMSANQLMKCGTHVLDSRAARFSAIRNFFLKSHSGQRLIRLQSFHFGHCPPNPVDEEKKVFPPLDSNRSIGVETRFASVTRPGFLHS